MENNALPSEERKGYWGDVLKKAVMYTLAVIGLLAVWLGWLIYSYFSSERDYFVEVPDKILLTINFDAPINEIRSEDLFGEFSGRPQLSFYDLISLIRQAKLDPKSRLLLRMSVCPALVWRKFRNLRMKYILLSYRARELIFIPTVLALWAAVPTNIIWQPGLMKFH